MNRRLSIGHSGVRVRYPTPAGRSEEPRRTAVVDAAFNLVRTQGAVAFMTRAKALAWADLQLAVEALESAR